MPAAHLLELALGDAIPVEDDAGGLEAGRLVELDEQLPDHGSQVLDDLLSVLLDTHGGAVAVGVCIHAAHDLWDTQLAGDEGSRGPSFRVLLDGL